MALAALDRESATSATARFVSSCTSRRHTQVDLVNCNSAVRLSLMGRHRKFSNGEAVGGTSRPKVERVLRRKQLA